MNSPDWNDLRYLLAVARSGSAASAARSLNVSHATVLRRLQALEQAVGAPLFHRLPTGYTPTEAGRRFVEVGESFESALTGTQREIDGQTHELIGTIRFTTTDSMAYCLMPEILAGFRERYPGITVELLATNARLDLDKREADVSLRPTQTPPPSLVGRHVGKIGIGLYAAPSYLERLAAPGQDTLEYLMPVGALAQTPLGQWLLSRHGGKGIAAGADSYPVLCRLAEAGFGATVLPHFVARQSALVLLEPQPPDMSANLWLLTHPHLRHTGRIRAFMEYVAQAVHAMSEVA